MNTDPRKSAQPCGCDEGANHECQACRDKRMLRSLPLSGQPGADVVGRPPLATAQGRHSPFPASAAGRKAHPVFTGVLMYFPNAIAAVSNVSKVGNDQHNPGEPLHWAREKSTDQMDTATRHMIDHGTGDTRDEDGMYHLAKAAWRILAELELTIEKEEGR